MAAHLSEELRKELALGGDKPLKVVDDKTNHVYILVSADVFERLLPYADDAFDIRETYAAQSAAAGAAGWNDPAMDIYNDYDAHKSGQDQKVGR